MVMINLNKTNIYLLILHFKVNEAELTSRGQQSKSRKSIMRTSPLITYIVHSYVNRTKSFGKLKSKLEKNSCVQLKFILYRLHCYFILSDYQCERLGKRLLNIMLW